jgi:hypothetical protein
MEAPRDDEPRRVPEGQFLGVMQWHAADGTVRRWTVRQGPRANNIAVTAKGKTATCGWDYLFRKLRKHLSIPKRIFTREGDPTPA